MALERKSDSEYYFYDKSFRVAIIRKVEVWRPHAWLWRSVTGDSDPGQRALLGYFPSLEMAASVTWKTWRQHGTPVENHSLG